MGEYTVTQDKNGYWYAHRVGFPNIPILGSISKSKRHALSVCAASMGLSLDEYIEYRRKRMKR